MEKGRLSIQNRSEKTMKKSPRVVVSSSRRLFESSSLRVVRSEATTTRNKICNIVSNRSGLRMSFVSTRRSLRVE